MVIFHSYVSSPVANTSTRNITSGRIRHLARTDRFARLKASLKTNLSQYIFPKMRISQRENKFLLGYFVCPWDIPIIGNLGEFIGIFPIYWDTLQQIQVIMCVTTSSIPISAFEKFFLSPQGFCQFGPNSMLGTKLLYGLDVRTTYGNTHIIQFVLRSHCSSLLQAE